ncbi:MAG: hypothetical protein M0Q24_01545 [Sulfurimonas sp.]|uniref:YobI family P-loop NTPase n=1 Tax=Sulfurimonas sp. TaxID=2022749 RepID=UPI0025D1F474|nr:hypothetical protein [Sulfurimonas sp.]MCK9490747.1 hypothetical protein [Sulfurimonas sp.]
MVENDYTTLIGNIKSLTPNEKNTENELYIALLDHATAEREDTKNIALSGPYGAGKSTILNAFKKYNIDKKEENRKKIVTISMASFCEIIGKEDVQVKNESDETQESTLDEGKDTHDVVKKLHCNTSITNINTIEKTILQQLIYSVDKDQIPLSKFSRIAKINKDAIKSKVLDIFLWIASIVIFYNFYVIKSIFSSLKYIESLYIILMFPLSFLVIYLSMKNITDIVYYFRRLNLSKIAFKNVELIFSDENSSVLNHNIDEILYFFEATNIDVILIEDLDRFEKPEIFVNLRELNNQINSSSQVKQKVSFIYAVKEDMFSNEDRVKFFDLIIPVIPFINSENSYEMIDKMIRNLGLRKHFSNNYIYDVSIFINDMRVLTNIINEFLVYFHKLFYKKIDKKIDIDLEKLFSIIIYKNFHPDDFSKLHKRDGDLYTLIHKTKDKFLSASVENLNQKIQTIRDQLNNSEEYYLENIEELNKYLMLDIGQKNNINQILLNEKYESIENISKNEKLLKDLLEINEERLQCSRTNGQTVYVNSNNIISLSKTSLKYDEKMDFIQNKKAIKQKALKEDIELLIKEKNALKSMTINQLVDEDSASEHIPKSIKESEILLYLVSRGHISTDYPSYISLVHDLSEIEIDFVRSVKSSKDTDPNIVLSKVDSIVKKLSLNDFKKESVLNISLVEYLVKNREQYSDKYSALLDLLKKQKENINNFIYLYLRLPETDKSTFVKELAHIKNDLWNDLVSMTLIDYVDEDELLYLLFMYADLEDIIKTNESTNSITTHINEMSNFIRFVTEKKLPIKKVQDYIKRTKARVENISMPNSDEEKVLFKFIYDNDLYLINLFSLQKICSYYKGDYSGYEGSTTYSNLSELPNKKVIEYIDEEINLFIADVYMTFKHSETDSAIKSIIDNHRLEDHYRQVVIEQMENVFEDVEFVDAISWEHLFKYRKVKPSWKNVLTVYSENENSIPEYVVGYLNEKEVVETLRKQSLLDVNGYEENEEFLRDFRYSLYFKSNLTNENLKLYRETSNRCWNDLDIGDFNTEKLKTIVMSNYLCTEPNNYNNLKELTNNVDNLHILLIENNVDGFLKEKADYDLGRKDLDLLLNSSKLKNSSKLELFSFMELELVDFKIDFEFLKYVLSMSLIEHTDKVELIINQVSFLEEEQAIELVSMLGGQFEKIITQKQFDLENNELNEALAVVLDAKRFIKSFVPMSGQSAGRLRIRTKVK